MAHLMTKINETRESLGVAEHQIDAHVVKLERDLQDDDAEGFPHERRKSL
jgi:hypothetical protein